MQTLERPLASADPNRAVHMGMALKDAARNAVKLTGSLLGTWGVAVVVRLLMPRLLGPELFGVVSFADALTATVFVLLTFGLDTYIRKEISVRPEHADDFFATMLLLRAGVTLVLLGGLSVAMALSHQPPLVRTTVYVFGAGQFFFASNNSFAALLQARARVGALSVLNVVFKLVWGVGIVVSLAMHQGPIAIAAWFFSAELLRAISLLVVSRRHVHLRLVLRPRATLAAVAASLPFFLSTISQTVCTRLGSSMLGFFATKEEVGYYGAGWTLAGMALLLAPLINWVLLPLLSQAAARSEQELTRTARRANELVLGFALPVALLLAVCADVWVRLLFGVAFAPAAAALRIMAPVFVLTYTAMVSSSCLILKGQAWTVTRVSIGTLLITPVLLILLVPRMEAWLGVGGAGVGAALALLGAEAVAVTQLLVANQAATFDAASTRRLAVQLVLCLVVWGVDALCAPLGVLRVAIDAGVYTVLALATRCVPLESMAALWRAVGERRRPLGGVEGGGR